MKTFEVELRALISKDQYQQLLKYFSKISSAEIDNARTYTFLTSDINIKVKNMISKGKAKITVKNGAEYKQDAKETELEIEPKDIKKAVELIKAIGKFKRHIPSYQKRTNFKVNDISISLKHDTHWKYHMEAEIMVKTQNKIPQAKEKLEKFFKDLGLKPMTENENQKLINSIVTKFGFKKI